MINDKASLAQIPSGVGVNTLFSVVPNTSAGDFAYTGATNGTRVNKDGLIETIPANVPRLNYNFINGVVQPDPHLLLEPQRINIYTYSQDLNQGNSLTNTTIDADSIVSPDGSLTGNKLTQTSGALVRKTLTILSGTYAWSFFAKKGDLRYLNARSLFVLNGTTPANGNTIIDLDTNTIAYKGTNVTSASIEQYPNDWIKVEIVATDNATGSGDFVDFFFTDSDTNTQSTGVAGNGFIWGVQFEAGTYATSYIPTQGETNGVTRALDNAQIASGAEDIIGSQNEGTLFIDLEIPYDTTSSDYFQFSISDPDAEEILDNRVFINFISGEAQFQVFSGGSGVGFCNTPVTKNIRLKIAGSYETDNFVLFKDGFLADDIDTGGTVNFTTQMESIRYADFGNGLKFQAKVYQTMFFKEALTQDELETLTSYKSFNEMATQQLYIIE
jgi:hypothetical protein